MTSEGIQIVKSTIEKKIKFESKFTTYDKRSIFRRAHYLVRTKKYMTLSMALKQVWAECKKCILESRKELSILKDKLNKMFTPVEYFQTADYQKQAFINMMEKI